MKECIKVQHITKKYGERIVVNDLNFTVKTGEVFGLLGHNGAGKSTTIDCILGLTKVNQGKATILDQNAKKDRKKLFEKVGVQLQHSHYQTNIKVNEICEEMSALYKHPTDYQDLLKQFQLESFINHKVNELSGGEKQKLSVLLALIPHPEVIFLDELTTGLDVAARREVWQILKKLKEEGMTIFLTTHYMEEAENLCDHILILKEGQMVIEGTVQEIVEKSPYKSLEEAYLWYTGEENLV
ncbi:MAG: ABC transporter ATP-binding protein [Coprobacillus sp.]